VAKPLGLANPTAILRALSLEFLNHRTVKNKTLTFPPPSYPEVAWDAAWPVRCKQKKRAQRLLGDIVLPCNRHTGTGPSHL